MQDHASTSDESISPARPKQLDWLKPVPFIITIFSFSGLNAPLVQYTEGLGWLGLVVGALSAAITLGFYLLLRRAIPLTICFFRSISSRPWTRQSRPPRWRVWNFGDPKRGWRERLRTITRRRRETFISPTSRTAPLCSPPPAEPPADPTLIMFLDDAYGLKVAGSVPGMLFRPKESRQVVAEAAKKMLLAAQRDTNKVCVVIVPSRKSDAECVGGMFHHAVEGVVAAVEALGDALPSKPRWAIRVDSCLRTHFAEELAAIEQVLSGPLQLQDSRFDCRVFAPCNVAEKRVTNFGVQFYQEDKSAKYRPMAEDTEYSARPGFRYTQSNLALWIQEKTKGELKANAVHLTNVNELRTVPAPLIAQSILADAKAEIVVFDGVEQHDAVAAINVAMCLENTHKKRVLYQVGTTMAALLSGRQPLESLSVEDIKQAFPHFKRRGLTIVGSLTNRTRSQVCHLQSAWQEDWDETRGGDEDTIVTVTFDDQMVAANHEDDRELNSARARVKHFLKKGEHVVVLSGLWADNRNQSYPSTDRRDRVLTLFSKIVEGVRPGGSDDSAVPGWIVFKGSDTAYDCLSRGVHARNICYLGPIVRGALLCKVTDEMSPWADTPLILFAGNSGDEDSLHELLRKMHDAAVP